MLNSCIASRKSIGYQTYADDTTMEIIRYASLAGSSHNTQPWLVDIISDTLIHVRADLTRKLQVVDPTGRGLYISLGAFIENLCIASRYYGFEPEVFISAGSSRDNLAAEITLSRGMPGNYDLRRLEERTTLRTPFRRDDIKQSDIEIITGGDVNCHFFPAAGSEGQFISRATTDAYTIQANDKAAQDELAGWIRFSNRDVAGRRDGLTTSGMGILGFAGFMVSRFYKPDDSKKQSFVNTGVEKTRLQTENCGGWLVITRPVDTPADWIETGRLYQRAHLECRSLMIGLHPMNQMIEVAEIEESAGEFLGLNGKIQFIARIGYVDSCPSPVSVRRSVHEFVTDMR